MKIYFILIIAMDDGIVRRAYSNNGNNKRGRGRPKGSKNPNAGRPKGVRNSDGYAQGQHKYPKCSFKESRFIDNYLLDPTNATRAAIDAGYPEASATQQAAIILNRTKIKHILAEHRKSLSELTMVDATRIVAEEARLAFSDIRHIPGCPQDIPDEIAFAIASFEIVKTVNTTKSGDVIESEKTKYTLWPKGQALERLSRQLGLYEKDNLQKPDGGRRQINIFVKEGDVFVAKPPMLGIANDYGSDKP